MNTCSKMFSDTRFEQFGRNKFFRELDGHRLGVVLATRTNMYDGHALNKYDLDRLIASKREGKIDSAKVVFAKINGGRTAPVYRGEIDAEEMAAKLATLTPIPGKFGEFYALPPGFVFPDHEKADYEPF